MGKSSAGADKAGKDKVDTGLQKKKSEDSASTKKDGGQKTLVWALKSGASSSRNDAVPIGLKRGSSGGISGASPAKREKKELGGKSVAGGRGHDDGGTEGHHSEHQFSDREGNMHQSKESMERSNFEILREKSENLKKSKEKHLQTKATALAMSSKEKRENKRKSLDSSEDEEYPGSEIIEDESEEVGGDEEEQDGTSEMEMDAGTPTRLSRSEQASKNLNVEKQQLLYKLQKSVDAIRKALTWMETELRVLVVSQATTTNKSVSMNYVVK